MHNSIMLFDDQKCQWPFVTLIKRQQVLMPENVKAEGNIKFESFIATWQRSSTNRQLGCV